MAALRVGSTFHSTPTSVEAGSRPWVRCCHGDSADRMGLPLLHSLRSHAVAPAEAASGPRPHRGPHAANSAVGGQAQCLVQRHGALRLGCDGPAMPGHWKGPALPPTGKQATSESSACAWPELGLRLASGQRTGTWLTPRRHGGSQSRWMFVSMVGQGRVDQRGCPRGLQSPAWPTAAELPVVLCRRSSPSDRWTHCH